MTIQLVPLRLPLLALALALMGSAPACTPAPANNGGTADSVPPPAAQAPATQAPGATAAAQASARIDAVPGLEVLVRDSMHLVRGKRVGLITNQSAVTRASEHAADYLRANGVNLVALYGPEHGIRGDLEAGETVAAGRDTKTGVPVYSLYDRTQRPTAEELRGVDVLVYDIQDVGARPYTFVWTMAMAIEEAAKHRIPFIVLDRPNPITDVSEGPVMHMDVRNVTQVITGYYAVPLRHGMTSGEVARYFNADAGVGAQLHVVPVDGWRPDVFFDNTTLPFIRPSPNIRSVDAELKFSGLVLADGATNIHTGRGTDAPFSYFGAPWLDTERLMQAVAKYELPGVRFVPEQIRPTRDPAVYTSYRDTAFTTLRVEVTDRRAFRPVWTTLVLLSEAKKQNPERFRVMNTGFTQMLGSRWAREAFDRGEDPRVIQRRWEEELAAWMQKREQYRIYPKAGR
ncbi:exo-beta-N-acetylmuramidase NamZ domain-containing protein [Longimicrobium sp.]|uniref:exo-beta-N-acetylmuramidase NamZ family protein n=1 Tax=Longimicrobium sp. TaxID=2029185 RepID=UPI003B3AE396